MFVEINVERYSPYDKMSSAYCDFCYSDCVVVKFVICIIKCRKVCVEIMTMSSDYCDSLY